MTTLIVEGAEWHQRVGLHEGELEAASILLGEREPIDVRAGFLEDPDRFRMGVGADGLVGQAREVEHGLGGLVRPAVVMREPVVDLP